MAITVKAPLGTPTGVTATPVASGSLPIGVTFYVRVTATNSGNANAKLTGSLYSQASTEISFTTDATNRRFDLSWTAVTGASYYNVYISRTSGDYSQKHYGDSNSTTATNSYTFSTEETLTYLLDINDTFALPAASTIPGNLDKELGVLYVEISGSAGTITIPTITAALDAAGYSAYYYWDEMTFILKGSIVVVASTTGTFNPTKISIFYFQGFGFNLSSSFTFKYGTISGGLTKDGCVLGWTAGGGDLANITAYGTAFWGSIMWLDRQYNILPFGFEIYTTTVLQDCSFEQAGTWGRKPTDSTINQPADLRYYHTGTTAQGTTFIGGGAKFLHNYDADFRDCTFKGQGTYNMSAGSTTANVTDIYDSTFTDNSDNLPLIEWGASVTRTIKVYWSIVNLIIDRETATAISGARVMLKDKNGTTVTGYPLTTDANGKTTKTDVLGYTITHNGTAAGIGKAYTTDTPQGPFTLTVTKAGYEDETTIFTHNKKLTEWTIALKRRRRPRSGRE